MAEIGRRHRTVAEDAVARRLGETWYDLVKRVAQALAKEYAAGVAEGERRAKAELSKRLDVASRGGLMATVERWIEEDS